MLSVADIELTKRVSIIMPFREDVPIRRLHRDWTVRHYQKMFPEAEVICGEDKSGVGWDGFSKGKFVNGLVREAKGEIIFLTDLDMVFVREALIKGFRAAFEKSMIFPQNRIYFPTKDKTLEIMRECKGWQYPRIDVTRCKCKPRKQKQANGTFILTRENFIKYGGYDERFVGWGSEDSQLIKAMTTMIPLPYWRMDYPSIHLFHEHDKKRFKKRDSGEKMVYYREYVQAKNNREKMEKVLSERGIVL